ncbi:MAG: hypothetical protein QM674_11630 [Burkholderiaceae bacterium]
MKPAISLKTAFLGFLVLFLSLAGGTFYGLQQARQAQQAVNEANQSRLPIVPAGR